MSVSNISASASSRQMRGPAEPKKRKLNVQLTEGEKAEKRWLQLLDKGTNLIWLDTSGSKKEDYFANGTLRCKLCPCEFKAYPSSGNVRTHTLGENHRLKAERQIRVNQTQLLAFFPSRKLSRRDDEEVLKPSLMIKFGRF